MSRLQTFLASNSGFFKPQPSAAKPAAPTRHLEGFLQQHASFFGAAKPQAATYPMDARGNFHAEDPQTTPYQPITVPEGGRAVGVEGGWVVLDAQQEADRRAAEEVQAQRQALPETSIPALRTVQNYGAGLVLDAAGVMQRTGLTTEEPTLLSPGGNADQLHRLAAQTRLSGTLQSEKAMFPTATRVLAQAGTQIAKTVPLALATGPVGPIVEATLTRGSQAVQEGRDAGLKGWDLARYATKAGTIEGGTTLAFQGLNRVLPGIGGLENIGSKTVQETAKQTLMRLGVGAVGELAEEEAITVLDALNQTAEGVDPNAVKNLGETMKETAFVTLATMGLANTPKLVSLAPGPWAQRNPEAAAKLAAIENPSRKDLADAGISGARNTTPQERAEVAKAVKTALAAVEPTDAEGNLPTAQVVAEGKQRSTAARDGDSSFDFGANQPTEQPLATETEVPSFEPTAVEAPTPEAVSPELRNHYKEMTGLELGELVKPKREHIPTLQFFNARRTKVQFFKSPDGSTANSFYDPKTRTVFLNSEKTGDPLWYLVGHEYAHASGADQRLADLPPEVLDEAKRNYAAGAAPAYLKKLQANPRLWEREAVARYVGEVLADPEQRARIRNENPTLWQKIVEAVKRLLGADKVPPSIRKVLDELNTLPPGETPLPVNAAATPQTPQATTTATANPNDRYADYTGFANPAQGTVAGDMQQATAEGMGATKRDARPRSQRIQDAAAEYSLDPQGVRAELDEAIRSDQPLSDRQSDLLNIVRAEAAQKALTSKATDDLAEVARLNRAYLEKGSEAGKALQARSEAQWQTPEGRAVILAEELTGLTASELDALETAKKELRRLGGDTGPMLSDSGPMLADSPDDLRVKVARYDDGRIEKKIQEWESAAAAFSRAESEPIPARGKGRIPRAKRIADAKRVATEKRREASAAVEEAIASTKKADALIDRNIARKTDDEKQAVRSAWQDDKVSRAVQNVIRLERQIAAKQAAFRARMEAKGVIPSTPQGIQAMLNDRYATLYAVRQMRAWKNLGKGFGSSLTGGKVGLGGALDVMYEASMANILSGIRSVVMNAVGTPLNWAGHLIPRAVEATGNTIAKAATGGRKGTTGAQWGEFKYLLQGLVDGAKVGAQYAVESAANEVSVLDETSGRHGSTLEGHGTNYAIPGKLGWLVRLPGYGSNRFFDDLSRTTIAHMEARANAYRDAVENGLSGQALEQHVDALYNDKQSIAWQGDVRGAYETANKFAFQEKGGAKRQKVVNNLSRFRNEVDGVRWFLRFVKFPVNAAVQTKEWTPFHFYHVLDKASENRAAGREWSYGIKEDLAKAFVGTLALISIMGSLEDDEREEFFGITGSAHPDPAKRNSFRFGDTYVSYRAAEPFGSALSLLADTGLSIKKHGFGVDSTIGSMAALADTVINKPTMRGINDITTYAREYARSRTENDPEILTKATARVLSQQALSFMPRIVSSFTEAAGEGTGYEQRKRAINELFDLNISNIAAQYDAWGNKKEEGVFGNPLGDFPYKLLSPMDVVTIPDHPGNALIGRWNAQQTDAKQRFKVPELAAEYTRDGETFRMKPEQYQRYAELSGQIAAKLYEVGNFDEKNPTQQQVKALERNFADARKMAKELLHKEWNGGPKATADASTVAASIRQAQVRRLQETARSKPTLKVLPGEDVERAKKRIADWKVNRDDAVAELRRLKVLN